MHTVFFSIRRTDLRCLQLQRKILYEYRLTPARYVMLLVILSERGMTQAELPEHLGVSAMTVSRMVCSLVEIGMLERVVCTDDQRTYDLQLTPTARVILKRIHRDYIEPGYIWGIVYFLLRLPNEESSDGTVPGRLKSNADQLRTGLREYARFELEWCRRTTFPEEFDEKSKRVAVAGARVILEEALGPPLVAFP